MVARCTILSSRTATASGWAAPDMLLDGTAIAGPRDCNQGPPRMLPRQPAHAGCGILLEFEERRFEVFSTDVVTERSELLLLPLSCTCRMRSNAWTRFPGPVRGESFVAPHSPRPPPFAPPTPQLVAQLCSSASQPLWRSLPSRVRTSPATAPPLRSLISAAKERRTYGDEETGPPAVLREVWSRSQIKILFRKRILALRWAIVLTYQ